MLSFVNTDYDYATKYDVGKYVNFSEDVIPSILTSYVIAQIQQITDFYYFKVTKEVGFSDYIAYTAYNNHSYWWIIKIFNGILEETELKDDTLLKIPTMSAINKIFIDLKAKQTLYENGNFDNIEVIK